MTATGFDPAPESHGRVAHRPGTGRAGCQNGAMPHTLVTFHAHPDDEALLTAGTMA